MRSTIGDLIRRAAAGERPRSLLGEAIREGVPTSPPAWVKNLAAKHGVGYAMLWETDPAQWLFVSSYPEKMGWFDKEVRRGQRGGSTWLLSVGPYRSAPPDRSLHKPQLGPHEQLSDADWKRCLKAAGAPRTVTSLYAIGVPTDVVAPGVRESATDHSTHPTAVEYAVQFLFKGKSPQAAAKMTAERLGGQVNLFFGGQTVTIDPAKLEAAVWDRIANVVIGSIPKMKAGMEHFALEGTADQFRLKTPKLQAQLRALVIKKLGRDPFHDKPKESFATLSGGKKNTWVDITLADLRADPELRQELFALIQKAYSKIGGHFDIQRPEDLASGDLNWFTAVDVDGTPSPDVVMFGKAKANGIKSTGLGTDGGDQAKSAMLKKKVADLNHDGHYAEVSDAIAHVLLTKFSVPVVSDKETVERVLGKKVEWFGPHPEGKYPGKDGWYSRAVGGAHQHMKILVGKPR